MNARLQTKSFRLHAVLLVAVLAMVTVKYEAPPTVSRFMDSSAFIRAIVGPIGSGKSSGCVMEMFTRAIQQKPGPDGVRRSRWAIIRNTYRELEDTTRETFEAWIPEDLGKWNEQKFTFTMKFKPSDGVPVEAVFLFRALDKPSDVKKLLSLELTGAWINEARQIPKEVFDGLQGRVGRFPAKKDGGATWFGIILDTNPWHTGHWGYKLFSTDKPDGFELYEQPGGRTPYAENVENLPDDYYVRLTKGKDGEWIAEYIDAKYPKSDRGSIYGHLVHVLEQDGRIGEFEHPDDGVFATFDLGISDSTAIWWWRVGRSGVDVIDHYEGHGEALSHYFEVLKARRWKLKKIYLPHDAKQRSLQTGVSTVDQFVEEFGRSLIAVTPDLDVADGIAAGRKLLELRGTRFHSRCSLKTGDNDIDGIDALRSYRYEYDEDKKVYKKSPLHDWSSHTSDSFRYVAVAVKITTRLMKEDDVREEAAQARAEAAQAIKRLVEKTQTVEEAFEEAERDSYSEGRI